LEGTPGDLLAQVLQDTPRLHHLSIQLLEYGSDDVVPAALKAIKDYVSGQLTSLELKGRSYHIQIEDVEALFPSLRQLTRFEMDGLPNGTLVQMLSSLPLLTTIALRGDRNTTRRARAPGREVFQNTGLVAIATLLPLLKDLTVHFNENILAVGLEHISKFCPRLTRIDLRGCQEISSDGLASFLGAQPHLTHVSLADTLLQDSGLLILAASARAAQLRVLNIRKCRLVQAHGVGQVVRTCANLRELNFSLCSAVWMDVFTGTWACLGLLRLNLGGIHGPVPVQDGSDTYMSRVVLEEELEQMYTQLSRLHCLEDLTLLPLPFRLRLFELGRTAVENMARLEHISLVDRESALEDRDIIWLATRLPSLRTLDLDECTTRGTLLRDLLDINRSLKINLFYSRDFYGVPDPNLEDTDTEHYDATDSDDSDSDSEGDNGHYFGYGGGGNGGDDSDDPYYSPGEEPYQPAHLDIYDSTDESDYDDGANIYPSATPSSNSDEYETYDEDDDDNDEAGHGGSSFWDYRNPYYPTSDSDEPVPYYRDSQDGSEEDSEEEEEEEDSSEADDSDNSTSSGGEDDDEGSRSELSSAEAESGTEEDNDEDGSEPESDVSLSAGSVGNFSDEDSSQNGGENSDESLSDESDDSEVDSASEDGGEEEKEQYGDEQDVDEEEAYSSDCYDEDGDGGYDAYDDHEDYVDHNVEYDSYEDYDDDADHNDINGGGYSTDDY
ncbi:hypothetical protein BGZ47_003260, partial [Haplosporangium gracile]